MQYLSQCPGWAKFHHEGNSILDSEIVCNSEKLEWVLDYSAFFACQRSWNYSKNCQFQFRTEFIMRNRRIHPQDLSNPGHCWALHLWIGLAGRVLKSLPVTILEISRPRIWELVWKTGLCTTKQYELVRQICFLDPGSPCGLLSVLQTFKFVVNWTLLVPKSDSW